MIDHTVRAIEGALCPLADYIPCLECKQALAERVRQVVVQWSLVKARLARQSLGHSISANLLPKSLLDLH